MKDETLYRLIEILGPHLASVLGHSLRIHQYGVENLRLVQERGARLYASFHGRMLIPVWLHRRQGITALISQSRDGEAVTRLVQHLGYNTVRGSSHRGGRDALRGMMEANRNGGVTAIMVDGPRGPREDPKLGVLAIARNAGVPILPILGAAYPNWELHSWDHFQIPKPFSHSVIGYGEPLEIPKSAKGEKLERLRIELKNRLLSLQSTIDHLAKNER